MKRMLVFFIGALWSISKAYAQDVNGPFVSWEEFVASYLERDENATNEEQTVDEDMRDWLEHLTENPLQINRIDKEELLALPFLNEQQVDSLLAYREKKKGFLSLGELQLVSGMDYYSRSYLSLFVRCDSMFVASRAYKDPRIKDMLVEGTHEVETRLDVPLYRRKGYDTPQNPTRTNYYVGNPLHHNVRYRYHYGREVSYGITMEKDAGEPVAKHGFYPYDYWSGYVSLRPKRKQWNLLVGDFQVRGASGLIYGKGGFAMRMVGGGETYKSLTFSPHTSSNECHFFRGVAYAQNFSKGWRMNAFVSYRRLDARLTSRGDTARSILQTGLHRTLSEVETRRTLGCFTSGVEVSLLKEMWGVELNECFNNYSLPIEPTLTNYNQYYFRGRTASTSSLAFYVRPKNVFLNGECGVDQEGHWAMTHHMSYAWAYRSHVALDVRYFSPKYVSIYASPIQQGTRAANEWGLMLSTRFLPMRSMEVSGYIDWFKHPKPTYQAALPNSQGVALDAQIKYAPSTYWTLMAGYRLKSKQYTLRLEEKQTLEYRTTQKLRMASLWTNKRWEMNAEADVCFYATQSGEKQVGWMCSARSAWRPTERLSIKSFVACFFTDDFESRLYAYQPQLLRSYAMQAFNNHGMNGVVLLSWCPIRTLMLSLRASTIKYFNKDNISSRLDLIRSSWKNDVSIQVRWTIKEKKHGMFQ